MKKECIKELSKKSFVNTLNYVRLRIQAEKGHLGFYKTLQIKLLPLPATARQFTLRSISQVQYPRKGNEVSTAIKCFVLPPDN